MKTWQLVVLVAALTAGATLAAVAVAIAVTPDVTGAAAGRDRDDAWGRRGGGDVGLARLAAVGDSEARAALEELRAEHHREMREWLDTYGDDPGDAEAQAALRDLRQRHRQEARELLGEYGSLCPGMGSAGTSRGGGGWFGPGRSLGDGAPCHGGGVRGGTDGAPAGRGGGMMWG